MNWDEKKKILWGLIVSSRFSGFDLFYTESDIEIEYRDLKYIIYFRKLKFVFILLLIFFSVWILY